MRRETAAWVAVLCASVPALGFGVAGHNLGFFGAPPAAGGPVAGHPAPAGRAFPGVRPSLSSLAAVAGPRPPVGMATGPAGAPRIPTAPTPAPPSAAPSSPRAYADTPSNTAAASDQATAPGDSGTTTTTTVGGDPGSRRPCPPGVLGVLCDGDGGGGGGDPGGQG